MDNLSYKELFKKLLDAGVHFGHLTRRWNPKMSPNIFIERNGIHILDLNETLHCLKRSADALKKIIIAGGKVMFVATKKQAKKIIEEQAIQLKMPYVTERWLGGMLTNFVTIRKSLKKLANIDKMMEGESFQNLAKRERLMKKRERDKLKKILGGITEIKRPPAALFVVDIKKEDIAVREAKNLGIPIFGMVDTNSNPENIDFPIPSNDDSYNSISLITSIIVESIKEGLKEKEKKREETKLKKKEDEKKVLNEDK